jgi:transcriptional regulator with XRE-family HTH domain
MSAANWSRIETGDQGPPDDEIVRAIALALDASPTELIRLAGRLPSDPSSFEQTVLTELRGLRAELREGFERIEGRLGA